MRLKSRKAIRVTKLRTYETKRQRKCPICEAAPGFRCTSMQVKGGTERPLLRDHKER